MMTVPEAPDRRSSSPTGVEAMPAVQLYDTTLRDGTQREGISLSVDDKLKIARKLDEFGMHYIEGGWPGSNPKDVSSSAVPPRWACAQARLAAFGSTRRKGIAPEDDANLQALLAAETPVVTLVGKSWDLHVTQVLETTLDENLAMIGESVAYCREARAARWSTTPSTSSTATRPTPTTPWPRCGGRGRTPAPTCWCCATPTAAPCPGRSRRSCGAVAARAADARRHPHARRRGCGVANTLAAVRAGAVHVQGTINGYGERVGNANLCSIIPDLQLKMGLACVAPDERWPG